MHLTIPALLLHQGRPLAEGIRVPLADLKHWAIPIRNTSENHLSPPHQYYYSYPGGTSARSKNESSKTSLWSSPILNPNLEILFKCPVRANRFTNHIRLPNTIQNISMIVPGASTEDKRVFWNPTIISMPFWSENEYLVVSRIVTNGNHQQNVLCEANICYIGASDVRPKGKKLCTVDDLASVGLAGGMRCATAPLTLSVPPTPAEYCGGDFGSYVDIPGFHDPRIFWSGKGEPLMMVNTQSRYACFGLWIIDIRTLHPTLAPLLASSPLNPSLGPLMSYPSLTELTRNPASTRAAIEKNWMFFFSGAESYIHYEISPHGGRSFAKLLGGGLTTTNLTDALEKPCLMDVSPNEPDEMKKGGTWHQATNSLRLVLCERKDTNCKPNADNTVFFAVVHRKHANYLHLPLRYERYFIVWSAVPPFSMLGISQHPILMANETASGWLPEQNWDDDAEEVEMIKQGLPGKDYWAYFTYTVSIAYAWGRSGDEAIWKNTGFLDDEVILGIGVDDSGQVFARVRAGDLVQCLRACPGRNAI
ncbi:MAG: hypothetical protein M1827_001055 [Pycnora praestabilis]|nr:MAG: hypothetical protein M1827_001055 [Pycnora praestabilis]